MADALFRKTDDGYRVTFVDCAIEFEAHRLNWKYDELHGQLAVSCGLDGARTIDGSVSAASFNFSSSRARRDRAKEIAERIRVPQLDYVGMLEETCQRIIKADLRGEPAIVLRDLPRPTPDHEYIVHGYRCLKRQPTINFGDGGTFKSTHALYTIGRLQQQGVRCALFDWEQDEGVQRLLLEQLFGDQMPDLRYARCDRPLIYEADRLRKIVRDDRIDYVLFDSVAYACAGPPEAAEHVMSYFRTVRQLNVGSLHIAHVRQGDDNDQKPFGSTFWHNSARMTWNVKLAGGNDDQPRRIIALHNRKLNLGRRHRAVGFEITFADERITVDSIAVADVPELAEGLPLWERMRDVVGKQPQTLAQLATVLGANVDTLDRTVRRKSGLFVRVPGDNGISRIALVARGSG